MKDYHAYKTVSLGGSDVATLIIAGCNDEGVVAKTLQFGYDGDYCAYLVDENAEIGSPYTLEGTFLSWLTIYDDDSLVLHLHAREIKVYRAGEYGCIIQTFGQNN